LPCLPPPLFIPIFAVRRKEGKKLVGRFVPWEAEAGSEKTTVMAAIVLFFHRLKYTLTLAIFKSSNSVRNFGLKAS